MKYNICYNISWRDCVFLNEDKKIVVIVENENDQYFKLIIGTFDLQMR